MKWNCEPQATLHATYLGDILYPQNGVLQPMITVMSMAYWNERPPPPFMRLISLAPPWHLDDAAKHLVVGGIWG